MDVNKLVFDINVFFIKAKHFSGTHAGFKHQFDGCAGFVLALIKNQSYGVLNVRTVITALRKRKKCQ